MKRSPLRSTGGLKPGRKGFRQYEGQAEFRQAVLERDGGCVRATDSFFNRPGDACCEQLDAHHLIEKSALAKRGLGEHAADTANGLTLCRFHHDGHHVGGLPLAWDHVPGRAKDFADALGLTELLIRTYPTREDT